MYKGKIRVRGLVLFRSKVRVRVWTCAFFHFRKSNIGMLIKKL